MKDVSAEPRPLTIIQGAPCDQWGLVEAAQHAPFLYVSYNGYGAPEDDAQQLPYLLDRLASTPLDRRLESCGDFVTTNPCAGAYNPAYGRELNAPRYIDGPRLFEADGVVHFSGNFLTFSHAFSLFTNDPSTIQLLTDAIRTNQCRADYLAQEEPS